METQTSFVKRVFTFILPNMRLNKSLRILITTNSVLIFIVGLFAPFYAIFVQHIGGTIAFAGFSWAVFSIVAGVLILLFSKWELKIKEQELLIMLGYLLRGGVFMSYAFMTSVPQLIVTQVLWGVASALGTPAFDAVYSAHTSKDNSLVEWGNWEGISSIVTGIAALLGGIIIQILGYETMFVIMAVISVGLGVYIYSLPRDLL